MADWTNSVLVLRDDDGAVLAAMRWDPLAGLDGAFSGIARLTGTAAQWELVSPGDWWAHGAVTGPWIRPVGGREWDVDGRRVAAWMSDPSSVKQSIPHSGCLVASDSAKRVPELPHEEAREQVVIDGRVFRPSPLRNVLAALSLNEVPLLTSEEVREQFGWDVPMASKVAIYGVCGTDVAAPGADQTVSLTKIPEGKQYVRTEVRFSSDIDLSPLSNLATAVGWGIALRGLVDEWRAWHPAARVSWDLDVDGNVWFTFAVDGIGEVLRDSVSTRVRYSHDVDDLMEEAQRSAAMAMAPHYVAPAPKPENRDAALRRFADEMRAAKAADRGAA